MSRLPDVDASTLPAAGALIGGKYRIERELGRGGMGVVYAALHVVTGKRVAIKWLLPDASGSDTAHQRLLREARTASSLADPNIVDVFDIVEDQQTTFLVMEFLQGESLAARLARGPIAIESLLQLLLPAMRAVGHAHACGVVHRDLKPDNLFICALPDGSECLKVLDFGISKFLTPGSEEPSITRSGMTVGSPHYMPMEQLQGLADIDARIDVYAFGVILYEALTGQKPFAGTSYGEIAIRVATHTPELPRRLRPNIPPMLERAVLGALARDRAARYPNMQALISALETALHPERDGLDLTASAHMPTLPASFTQAAHSETRMRKIPAPPPIETSRPLRFRPSLLSVVFACLVVLVSLWLGWRLPLRPLSPSPSTQAPSFSATVPSKQDPIVEPQATPSPVMPVEPTAPEITNTKARPQRKATAKGDTARTSLAPPIGPSSKHLSPDAGHRDTGKLPLAPGRAGRLLPDDF